jgi:hypothetical protein
MEHGAVTMEGEYCYNYDAEEEIDRLKREVSREEGRTAECQKEIRRLRGVIREQNEIAERLNEIKPLEVEHDDNVCNRLKAKYRVHGCIDHGDHIEGLVENDRAEFWGVYKVQEDDTEEWIADFLYYDDAQMFALEKGKEKKDENL